MPTSATKFLEAYEPQRSAEAFLQQYESDKPSASAFLDEPLEFTATDNEPKEKNPFKVDLSRVLYDPLNPPLDEMGRRRAPTLWRPPAPRPQGMTEPLFWGPVPKVTDEAMREALPGLPARTEFEVDPLAPLGVKIRPSAEALAGVERVGAGFVDFLSSPVGLLSSIAGPVAPRVVSGLFAADMVRNQAQMASAAGKASVEGGEGEKVETGLGLLLNTGLAGLAGAHAMKPGVRPPALPQWAKEEGEVTQRAQRNTESAEGAVSPEIEEALAKVEGDAPNAELPSAAEFLDLQTSGEGKVQTVSGLSGVEGLRRELEELNDQAGPAEMKGVKGAFERAPDVLDWMEQQNVRVRKWRAGDESAVVEDWRKAQESTKEAFDEGGLWPDEAAEMYRRETGKDVSDDAFLAEIEGVKRMREAAAEAFRSEWGKMSQDAAFEAEAIGGARRDKGQKVEGVGADELAAGDRFEVGGEKVVVERVKVRAGDETMVESVTVKDGPRFGKRVVPADALLKIDEGSLERAARGEEKFWGETWADRVIEEAKGRVSSGLDPELLAAYAVKGAATLVRGVQDAGEWAAEMVREYGEKIREHLPEIRRRADDLVAKGWQGVDKPAAVPPGLGERAFPKQVDVSTDISGDVKLQQGPRLYERRSNPVDAASAKAWIDSYPEGAQGLDGATDAFIAGRTGLHPSEETMVGMELLKKWGMREQVAALSRDKAEEEIAVRRAVDLADAVTRRSTDIAQALQAFSAFSRLTPAGMMESARRTIDGAFKTATGAMRPGLENIKETIRAVNEAVAGEVVNDPAVVKAAESVMQPAVEKVATAAASKRLARELMNGRILETAKEKAAGISELAGRHFAGEDPARTLQRKLWEDLKIPYDQAKILARRLEVEFARLVRAEAEKLFKEARRAVWKRRQGELLAMARRHFLQGDDARPLWEKVREIMKIDEARAKELADKLAERFADLATERKRAALRKLSLPARIGSTAARGLHEKLIELSNIGALDDAAFDRAIAEKLKLPQWSREMAVEIKKRAEAIQKLPEGFRRTRAAIEMMNYIARVKGVKMADLAWAFWYANVLSGPMTHAVNAGANALNLTANFGYSVARSPRSLPGLTAALWEGLGKGSIEGLQLMDAGMVDGTRLAKVEALRPLEVAEFKGVAAPLKLYRYVARLMGAADLVFFKGAEEMRSYAAARKIAADEGLKGEQLERRVVEVMGKTEERVAAARAMADEEGLTGLDWKRRVSEIIEQSRPEILRENAKEYALRVTFNQQPHGVLGSVARGIHSIRREVPAVQAIVPFVDIIANVTNEGLNYFPPVGAVRALRGHWHGEFEGRPITDRTVLFDQWAKVTAGGVGLMTLAVLSAQGEIEVTGAGPRTADQKKQLEETGWIPYSIKRGGKYYSYGWTPAAIPIAILGNYLDAQKYKNLDAAAAGNRAAYALSLFGKVILQQSFLSGVADLVTWADKDNTKSAGDAAGRGLLRTATSFVVPNAMRQIDRMFDPGVYEAKTFEAAAVASVPFARRLNRPAINVLGEPVNKYVSDRFLSSDRGDVLWETLAAKQAWVSVPDRDVVIGDKKDGPGMFRVLNDAEFYSFVQESGRTIRAELMSRIGELQAASPDEAKEIVRSVTAAAREEAKGRF